MLVKTKGAAIVGMDAITITVEVNVSMGQGYSIVGLPIMPLKKVLSERKVLSSPLDFICPEPKWSLIYRQPT
jgi:magnesium chelatase family protein